MKKNETFAKIKRGLIVTFLALAVMCVLCIFIAFALEFVPFLKINEWDLLAFLGSLLVAFITIRGIRVPIIAQRNEQQVARYERELKQLHKIIKEIRFITYVPKYKILVFEEDTNYDGRDIIEQELRFKFDELRRFIILIDEKMPELLDSLDWTFFHKFDKEFGRLQRFLVLLYPNFEVFLESDISFTQMEHQIEDYLAEAIELYNLLYNYQNEISPKYYSLLESKPNFFLK
ncbi:hypothetical protein M3231_09320 [Neobacillus mesonae]|nr:hypothetical protein [Neobacillus mesonae]